MPANASPAPSSSLPEASNANSPKPPHKIIPAHEWCHTDPAASHELWEEQVELERLMLKSGADKFRDRVLVAKEKGQTAQLHPVRNLLTDWLPDVVVAIQDWVRQYVASRGRGALPLALPYMQSLDPNSAAAIALREVLDSLSMASPKLVTVAMKVGRVAEYEQRVRYWEKQEPALYHHYRKEMDRNKATATHRRRVNINRFNHLLETKDAEQLDLEWTPWSQEVQFRVGLALLDCVVRATGWFEVVPDHNHRFRKGRAKSPQYLIVPKEGMREWVAKVLEDAELASPDYKPTIMPPKRWSSSRDGGYWTPYVRSPRLVRFKASQETQQHHAADEYDAFEMDAVYDAINTIQETAYKVNGRVLDVAIKAWALDRRIGKLPQIDEAELPARTPRMVEHSTAAREARAAGLPKPEMDEATKAELRAWKHAATPIHRFNAKRMSRMRSTTATVQVAEEYRNYDAIYFPHMLDFRGRIYPIPAYLQPQGDDLSRSLLLFSEEMPITEGNGGDGWLAVHLANCWGYDKEDYDARIAWVEEREQLWRDIEADPMANLEWADADKPWQSLAAIFEWVAFLNHGYGFMSNLPVMVDGTCNGIQHLSALTRDAVSGAYVNLIPASKPQDIYKYVAEGLQETLLRIEAAGGPEGEKATYWLDLCDRNLPRTLTKRQVMVLPYGGSKDAFFKYTRAWLDENNPADPLPEDATEEEKLAAWTERTGYISFLVTHLWDEVSTTVSGGLKVMEWLQDCAKAVALGDQPIYWVTPAGFVVRHFYGLNRAVRVDIKLDGQRYTVTRAERTAKLSVKDQIQGIAPNFIHSLDASALMTCARLCREAGIRSLMTVHDAYGTHAANMWPLANIIRQSFVETHEVDVLGNFRAACQRVLVDHLVADEGMDVLEASQVADEKLPPMLEMGDLDLRDVLQSDYFFA